MFKKWLHIGYLKISVFIVNLSKLKQAMQDELVAWSRLQKSPIGRWQNWGQKSGQGPRPPFLCIQPPSLNSFSSYNASFTLYQRFSVSQIQNGRRRRIRGYFLDSKAPYMDDGLTSVCAASQASNLLPPPKVRLAVTVFPGEGLSLAMAYVTGCLSTPQAFPPLLVERSESSPRKASLSVSLDGEMALDRRFFIGQNFLL